MRVLIAAVGWGTLALAVLYVAVIAEDAVILHNPLALVGLGLIGAGLCLDARRREVSEGSGEPGGEG